eukprot:Hpha_TRINITY_DN16864_c1_g1::TRINITY_DN16864_c1_g1_i10::g.150293::m.150293
MLWSPQVRRSLAPKNLDVRSDCRHAPALERRENGTGLRQPCYTLLFLHLPKASEPISKVNETFAPCALEASEDDVGLVQEYGSQLSNVQRAVVFVVDALEDFPREGEPVVFGGVLHGGLRAGGEVHEYERRRLQDLLGDLAAHGRERLLADLEELRELPGGHVRVKAVLPQRRSRDLLRPLLGCHPRDDHLPDAAVVGDADDGRLADVLVLVKHLLHVARGNVKAAVRGDQLLDPADDVQVTVLVEFPDVTRAHEAVRADGLRRLSGVLVIFLHDEGVHDADLTLTVLFWGRRYSRELLGGVLDEDLTVRRDLPCAGHYSEIFWRYLACPFVELGGEFSDPNTLGLAV